jgi:hypothetical protein
LQTAVWFLVVTAIGIPIGNAISTWISSQFNRGVAEKTALLTAAQRRRDAEIAQLHDCQAALLDAATAVQSYVLCVDKAIRVRTTIPDEAWPAMRDFVERAVVGAQRLSAMARAAPSDELSNAYTAVADLIMKVVRGNDDPNARDPWEQDVTGPQPDTITRAVNATAGAIKELYNTYPAELGAKPTSPRLPSKYPNRSVTATR